MFSPVCDTIIILHINLDQSFSNELVELITSWLMFMIT